MPRIPLFVVAIALANFLVPLNSTMIVVALIAGLALGRASDMSALPAVFGIFALAGLASALVGATTLPPHSCVDVGTDEAGVAG